jgi:hypothetical protein
MDSKANLQVQPVLKVNKRVATSWESLVMMKVLGKKLLLYVTLTN